MGLGGTPIFGYIGMCSPQGIVLSYLSEKGYGIDFDLSEIGYVFVACEYSRLSFALATTCETRRERTGRKENLGQDQCSSKN